MAKLVYGLNQSLDGYVDHLAIGRPSLAVSRHFMEHARDLTGMVYGRRMYEIMRYWDEDLPDWDAEECAFAAVWRSKPRVGRVALVEVGFDPMPHLSRMTSRR